MDIHAAIKFGHRNKIRVNASHPTEANATNTPVESPNKSANANPAAEQKVTTNNPLGETPSSDTKATPNGATDAQAQPSFKVVNLNIAGNPHKITSPAEEVENLEKSAQVINDKIRTLRSAIKGKNPNNEELLVLVCLDLLDQINTQNKTIDKHNAASESAKNLIKKITKDASSVL